MDAFISYSSADKTVAARIERDLQKRGLEIWRDQSEIRPGNPLRNELQDAIRNSRVAVLLWSKRAARSRWVAGEILNAFHLGRPLVVCTRDKTKPPFFLENTIFVNVQPRRRGWLDLVERAIRQPPDPAAAVPPRMGAESPRLLQTIRSLDAGQRVVTDSLDVRDLKRAKTAQAAADKAVRAARKEFKFEAMILNLAGYHLKNEYMVGHWDAIQAGRPPKHRLLVRAERCFFESLFVNPNDYSALNGLASIFLFERDLDAADFFNQRALQLAADDGVDYPDAQQDRGLIAALKARGTRPGTAKRD